MLCKYVLNLKKYICGLPAHPYTHPNISQY